MNYRLSALGISLVAIALLSLSAGCAVASEVTKIPPGSLVVDVRTPREFSRWHYPGALNIPVSEIERHAVKLGDKDRPIIVYCRSGNRSTTAKRILQNAGFTQVLNGGGLRDMKPLAPPEN